MIILIKKILDFTLWIQIGKHKKTIYIKNTINEHFGGITEYNNQIWIVSTAKIYVIDKKVLFNAKNKATIKPSSILTAKQILTKKQQGNFSFCTSYKDVLWIGTFNTWYNSKAYGYKIYYNNGLKLQHISTMEIPARCQGMDFLNDKTIFFSTSYGFTDSIIYKCKLIKTVKNNFSSYLTTSLAYIYVPSRSQEIYVTPSKNLYVLFESGSKVFKWNGGAKEKRVVLINF